MLGVQESQVVLDLIVAFKREYVDVKISQHPCRLWWLPSCQNKGILFIEAYHRSVAAIGVSHAGFSDNIQQPFSGMVQPLW